MSVSIYSQPNCVYCDMAKALAKQHNLDIVEYVIGKDITKEMFFELLPNVRSVPQIYVNSIYVGGYQEFKDYVRDYI